MSRRATSNEIWILSFGDLVTLLVCMFTALVAGYSHSRAGTGLAQAKAQEWLRITAQDIQPESAKLSDTMDSALKTLLNSGAGPVLLKRCDGAGRYATNVGIALVLTVARQISDSSNASPIVALHGSSCHSDSVLEVVKG